MIGCSPVLAKITLPNHLPPIVITVSLEIANGAIMVTIVSGCDTHQMVMVEPNSQPGNASRVWCPLCGEPPR
jgi:hypothetical protein